MGVDLKFTMAPADTALPSISSRTCVPGQRVAQRVGYAAKLPQYPANRVGLVLTTIFC